MAMITLKEYAERYEKNINTLRIKALKGGFETARKIGRDWFIDEEEPCIDRRIKSGKYINWRNPEKKEDSEQIE